METFEWTIALLGGALLLTAIARKLQLPGPTLLALGGTALALMPIGPSFQLDPELALALFVAPVLLDTAFDASQRDLKRHWLPIAGLVFVAVGLTTAAVAAVAHAMIPGLSWGAAIALGAIVAPPDAAAASAIFKQVKLPHRLNTILEGESLLNDATALLVYRAAVTSVMGGHASAISLVGLGVLGVFGGIALGLLVARITPRVMNRIDDIPSAIIVQFISTFGLWLLAERLHVSAVLAIVANAMSMSWSAQRRMPARLRLPSYSVWETTVFCLNVLAFVLVGLQLGAIKERVHAHDFVVAGVILGTVVGARFLWVFAYHWIMRQRWTSALLISWSGMRGIVTLAAAFALPQNFPHRDVLLLCSFAVVLDTLVLQGMSLPFLLKRLPLEDDNLIEREEKSARITLYRQALVFLADRQDPMVQALQIEVSHALEALESGQPESDLRKQLTQELRDHLEGLRKSGEISDITYASVQQELDRYEITNET